jgi:hypothetical protein
MYQLEYKTEQPYFKETIAYIFSYTICNNIIFRFTWY